jgi:hypothetical protein
MVECNVVQRIFDLQVLPYKHKSNAVYVDSDM